MHTNRRQKLELGLSFPLLDRLLRSSSADFKEIEIRPVETIDELKAAAHLVYHEYVRLGYMKPNKNHWKISLFQTLPTTVTFLAIFRGRHVLGTVSLVEDSPLGLPSDSIYKLEFDGLRYENHHLAEASMLAVNKKLFESTVTRIPTSVRLLFVIHMFRAMSNYLRSMTKVDELVASFHPKHENIYKFLQMEPLGVLKPHAGVKGSPAIARHANVRKIAENASPLIIRLFYGDLPPSKIYEKRLKLSEEDLRLLFVEHSNILTSATPAQFNYIKRCYPQFNLAGIIQSKTLFSHLLESLESRLYLDPDKGSAKSSTP